MVACRDRVQSRPSCWVLLAPLCAILTVVCQAMIYASLKPIRQWHNLRAQFYTAGAVQWRRLPGRDGDLLGGAWRTRRAGLASLLYRGSGREDRLLARHRTAPSRSPPSRSATGLGTIGPVRELEAPHTEENYLLREMGYAIARKHGERLRGIALAIGFALPAILLIVGLLLGHPGALVLFPLAAMRRCSASTSSAGCSSPRRPTR